MINLDWAVDAFFSRKTSCWLKTLTTPSLPTIGMICATRKVIFGFAARINATMLATLVAAENGSRPWAISLVPRWMST